MTKHADLGASKAHRFTKCTASVKLEKDMPDVKNKYALDGIRLHEIATEVIINDSANLLNELSVEDKYIINCYKSFFDEILNSISKFDGEICDVYCERLVDYSIINNCGSSLTTFGTADCIITSKTSKTIHVIDLKTGSGVVKAYENQQLLLYAIGAYVEFSNFIEIENIKLHIVQPKINNFDTWGLSASEMMSKWLPFFQRTVKEINEGGVFRPALDTCKYCKAKAKCPALFNIMKKKIEMDEDLFLKDEDLKEVLDNAELVELFIKSVKELVYEMLINNKEFKGYKLVKGKTVRKLNEDKIKSNAFILQRDFNLEVEDCYEKKLKTLSSFEKMVGKQNVTDFVDLVESEPVMVKEEDTRELWSKLKLNNNSKIN